MTGKLQTWVYRLAFGSLAVFGVLAVWLIIAPSEALTNVFGVALLVTLALGIVSGLVTIYAR